MRTSEKIRDHERWDHPQLADEVEQLETDYDLSMEVLRQIVDLTFPDLEVSEPYMATLKRKADDAVKRLKERVKMWRLQDESIQK